MPSKEAAAGRKPAALPGEEGLGGAGVAQRWLGAARTGTPLGGQHVAYLSQHFAILDTWLTYVKEIFIFYQKNLAVWQKANSEAVFGPLRRHWSLLGAAMSVLDEQRVAGATKNEKIVKICGFFA